MPPCPLHAPLPALQQRLALLAEMRLSQSIPRGFKGLGKATTPEEERFWTCACSGALSE